MRRIFYFLVIFAIILKTKPQVLKGTEVDSEDLKFLVYLNPVYYYDHWYYGDERRTTNIGAGTIVHLNWIITAAHLVSSYSKEGTQYTFEYVEVVVGTKDISDANRQEIWIFPEDVHFHPKYDIRYRLLNDVALLHSHEVPLVRSETLEPARLLTSKMNFEYGANCVVAGWGTDEIIKNAETEEYENGPNEPNHAKQGKVKLLKPRKCHRYSIFSPKKQFCYGCTQGSCSQTAQGDSGGPVVCAFQRKKHHYQNTTIDSKKPRKDRMRFQDHDPMKYQYVFAVHSFGCTDLEHKCTSNGPSVGTNIATKEIEEWMRTTMEPDTVNSDINLYVIAAATIVGSICIYFL